MGAVGTTAGGGGGGGGPGVRIPARARGGRGAGVAAAAVAPGEGPTCTDHLGFEHPDQQQQQQQAAPPLTPCSSSPAVAAPPPSSSCCPAAPCVTPDTAAMVQQEVGAGGPAVAAGVGGQYEYVYDMYVAMDEDWQDQEGVSTEGVPVIEVSAEGGEGGGGGGVWGGGAGVRAWGVAEVWVHEYVCGGVGGVGGGVHMRVRHMSQSLFLWQQTAKQVTPSVLPGSLSATARLTYNYCQLPGSLSDTARLIYSYCQLPGPLSATARLTLSYCQAHSCHIASYSGCISLLLQLTFYYLCCLRLAMNASII